MIKYVAGFLFSQDKRKVALIQKARPKWQAGKLNGIGGHVEENELFADAMRREFREETGVEQYAWNHFVTLTGDDWQVHFFYGFGDVDQCKTLTDEPVHVFDVDNLPENIIPNLKWLIPLALDPYAHSYREVSVGGYLI